MMAASFRLAILLTIFLACSDAYISSFSNGRPKHGFLEELISRRVSLEERRQARAESSQAWFDQKLNHFNSADTRRWKQRFFSAGPAKSDYLFVSVGGEGPSDAWSVTKSAMAYYAKKYNASCLELEHRYYGDSHPTPDTSTENLRFLSSEQALADLAAFIVVKKEEYSAEKVIVFGGSYAGNLAAWFRLKYPHLADGAVASSAPVLAQVDFKGYFEVVADALNTYKTGNVCTNTISAAVKKMESLMESAKGRDKLKEMFNLCGPIDINKKKDIMNLYSSLADIYAEKVQYNSESHEIEKVCSILANTSLGEPIERYAQVSKSGSGCWSIVYDVSGLKKDVAWNVTTRPWFYQTCTEFGYYATSDSDKQPFGHGFPVEFSTQECTDVFGTGFGGGYLMRAARDTNINYGGLNYTQVRVVFVNGDMDPWHDLSILKSLPNAPAIYIPGASHCANMYAPEADDPPAIVKAHIEIEQLIGQWLK